MYKLNVPFVANNAENLDCFEAALSMVLQYFGDSKKYSFSELEEITGKKPGLSTWPQKGILWMKEQGFDVINIEIFDYKQFIDTGLEYLKSLYGEEAAEWQANNSDILYEQKVCQDFVKEIVTEKRIPDKKDIIKLLDNSYLPLFLVNSKAIDNLDGYIGHIYVGIGYDKNGLYTHDPGLPPLKDRYIDFMQFERGWAFPDEKVKSITAFKRLNS